MNTIPHGPMKKDPHAVALGRRGGRVSSPAKAEAARERMAKQWERWRANGGRPRPAAERVPEEHRGWLLGLTKVDLAELTWLFAEQELDRRGSAPAGTTREEWDQEVVELVRAWGERHLTRAKGSEYCKAR